MAISFERTINMLSWMPDFIRDELDEKFDKIAADIATDAKNHHRFITRTGALEESVTAEYTGNTVRAYLDESIAPYGKYVHDGQRSWAPDPFLENAFTKHVRDIDGAIGEAVAKAMALPAAAIAGAVPPTNDVLAGISNVRRGRVSSAVLAAAAAGEEEEE